MRKVYLLQHAAEELEDIRQPLLSEVLAKLRLLREFLFLGTTMEGDYAEYRALTVKLFRIIYRIDETGSVEVNYIRHCRRALPDL